MIIEIHSDEIDLSAEKIVSDGKITCEYEHKITAGKIAFRDPADVILCQRHMITQIKSIFTDF